MTVSGLIFVGNIFWTLYLSDAPKAVFDSLLAIPTFIFKQFTALFKMANPNKNFKHSEHKVSVSIEDVLKRNEKIAGYFLCFFNLIFVGCILFALLKIGSPRYLFQLVKYPW